MKKNLALVLPELDEYERWALKFLFGQAGEGDEALILKDASEAKEKVMRVADHLSHTQAGGLLRKLQQKLENHVGLSGSNESVDK